jgi:hypothetical protein
MNLRRIFVFTLLFCAATFAAAFPFGFIAGVFHATGHAVPWWTTFAKGIAVPVAAIVVIAALAKRQSERTWEHAVAVAALAVAVSLPINVWLAGQPLAQWVAGALFVFLVTVPAGVLIGQMLRPS